MGWELTFADVLTARRSRTGQGSGKAERLVEELNGQVIPNSLRGRERMARIVEAATELFLRDGYAATSIDSILEASGGSKATLYNYFSTKDDLFRAVIEEVMANDPIPKLDVDRDPRTTLTNFVVERIERLSSPRHRALLRLAIAERDRFPDLASMYHERGPLRSRQVLAQYFGELERRRVLDSGTAQEAAECLIGMAVHQWVFKSLLLEDGSSPSTEAIRAHAAAVVDRFFAAFHRR